MTSLFANTYFLIKLDRVSCTNYFMSIHNLRYSVQLIQIATRKKTNLRKIPRCCASNNSVRVIVTSAVIVTQAPSFRRSRDLDKSNTFGHRYRIKEGSPTLWLYHCFAQKGCRGHARPKIGNVYFLCLSVCIANRIGSSLFSHNRCKYRIFAFTFERVM